MKLIYQDGYIHNLGIQDNPEKPMFGWLFYKHPDGDWVSLADLKAEVGIFLPPPSCDNEAHALTTQRLGDECKKNNELEKTNRDYKATLIAIHKGDDLAFVCSVLRGEVERHLEEVKQGNREIHKLNGQLDKANELAKEYVAKVNTAIEANKEVTDALDEQLTTANKRLEEYKKFTGKWSEHLEDCDIYPCTCGFVKACKEFTEALKALQVKKLVTCPECEEGSDGNCYCGYENVEPTRVEYEKFAQSVLDDHYCEPTDEQERCGVCKALRALQR